MVAAVHAGVGTGCPRSNLQIPQQGPVQLPQDLAPTGQAQLHICIATQSDERGMIDCRPGDDRLQRLAPAGRALDGSPNQSHVRVKHKAISIWGCHTSWHKRSHSS